MKDKLKKGFDKAKEVTKGLGDYAIDNPWKTGLGVTAALIAGKFLNDKMKKDEDN